MTPLTVNVIVSPELSVFACVMAARSEPLPLSAVVLTTSGAGTTRSSSDSRIRRKPRRDEGDEYGEFLLEERSAKDRNIQKLRTWVFRTTMAWAACIEASLCDCAKNDRLKRARRRLGKPEGDGGA